MELKSATIPFICYNELNRSALKQTTVVKDLSEREFRIGVKELLNILFHPEDLGTGLPSAMRGLEGTSGHQLIRDRRPEEYQSEVALEHDFEWQGYRLKVRGRLDGLMESDGVWLAEEIKTTYASLDQLSLEDYPVHAAQLKLYLFFWMAKNREKNVVGQLTYLNLNDLSERTFPITLTYDEGEAFFSELAVAYLTAVHERELWRQVRDASLNSWTFPFRHLRPGQNELMDTLNLALEQELDLLLEAATGIGKTIGVLYPALKRLATSDRYTQVFFLTAKTEGKEITKKTLSLAKESGLRLRTVFIEAKERVCLHPEKECRPDSCSCAAGYYARAEAVIPEILQRELLLPDVVRDYAWAHQLCPFELSLDLSLHADLIICDYNYVFDPGVYLRRFFLFSGRKDFLFLVDEAHNLVGRGREMYSAALSQKELAYICNGFEGMDLRLARACQTVEGYFEAWGHELKEEHRSAARLSALPEMLEPALEQLASAIERYLGSSSPGAFHTKVKDFYFELSHFIRVIGYTKADYAIYTALDGKTVSLHLFCLNPGPLLRKRLDWARSTVFFSATLSPSEYFRELLGANSDALSLRLTSPFPQENRLYMHVPGVDTRYKAREASAWPLAQIAADMVRAKNGNYMMFFPSYAYLNAVAPMVKELLHGEAEVYAQYPSMKEEQKRLFIQRITAMGTGRSHLGLAVQGGLFGEGVDLPGEQLIGVCIVGPGLPSVGAQQELIRAYFDERNGQGFLYAYVVPGMIRVIQAAGRVFRTPEDRGVVILVDDRFEQDQYQELLPPDWFMPGRAFTQGDYREMLEVFWEDDAEHSMNEDET